MGCKVKFTNKSCVAPSIRFTLTMWDVKTGMLVTTEVINREFYLNYVGCKGEIKILEYQGNILFYLNYVGCKERRCEQSNKYSIVLP